jgi:hypothetical protein
MLCQPLIGLLYQPRTMDGYGALYGMRIDTGNRSTPRKPVRVGSCPRDHSLGSNPSRVGSHWLSASGPCSAIESQVVSVPSYNERSRVRFTIRSLDVCKST